jgi:hypothetical protein
MYKRTCHWILSYARWTQSTSAHPTYSILSSHVCLGSPRCLFPCGFLANTLRIFLLHLRPTCSFLHYPWFYLHNYIWRRVNNATKNLRMFLRNVCQIPETTLSVSLFSFALTRNSSLPFVELLLFLFGELKSAGLHVLDSDQGMIWISTISRSVFSNFTIGRPAVVCYRYETKLRWENQAICFQDIGTSKL